VLANDETSLNLSGGFACPIPIAEYPKVLMAHGGGGKLSQQLIEKMFVPAFRNPHLELLHDGAVLAAPGTRLAFSTDSYVVHPLFFPGGDIGELAVNGTVNDLAMCGAQPHFLSAAFVIEEGLAMDDLWRIVQSMKSTAQNAGVSIVTGDTKVVDRGKGDGIFITTAGIGAIREGIAISPSRAQAGDCLILSGTIADHGIAIMSVREGLEFGTTVRSDTAALNGLVDTMLATCPDMHVLRDPTRGGVASALNEIAAHAAVGMELVEDAIPLREEVRAACELLGFDPLYVANEGKLIAIVPEKDCRALLKVMREHPLGTGAVQIGKVVTEHPGVVTMKSRIGGTRVVDMLSGEQLPRIC
jgi:hydrogenase expression/formation protein HypE